MRTHQSYRSYGEYIDEHPPQAKNNKLIVMSLFMFLSPLVNITIVIFLWVAPKILLIEFLQQPTLVDSFEETQVDELLRFGVLGCRHGARDIV